MRRIGMVVYITKDVKQALNTYRNTLRKYPISRDRIHEKYNNMVNALLALGKDQSGLRPCMHKKLGQRFSSTNKPILMSLYRFNYSDESKFQWSFGVVIDKLNNKITITKMIPSSFVTESKIYNNTKSQYKMKQKIRLTEGDLHRIIRNCVNEALNELDARTYASYANKRQAQANNSQNSEDAFKYQQKANAGVNAAQNAWNQKYGFSYNNGGNDWGEQSMGGNNNFTHNGNTNYGINYRSEKPNWDGNGYTHTNMAYNPQNNTIWKGNGQGEENVRQSNSEYEMGDNGAYKTARQMQNPNPQRDYVKGQGWR